jgi:hypothetical protein
MFAAIADFFRRKPDHRTGLDEAEGYASDTTNDYMEPTQPTERVNVLVVITTHGSTITRDIGRIPAEFHSSVDLIKADMSLEGTSCYVMPGKDLITPLSIIEGDFYQSNPGYDPVELAEACAEYSKDEQLVLHPANKISVNALLRTYDDEERYFREYRHHYDKTGRIIRTISGEPISNKRYHLSYKEFTSRNGRRYNNHKVKVSFIGKSIDLLSSDSGFLVDEFLGSYGNFVNPLYHDGMLINFKSVSFYLEDIMEFLSNRDTNFLVRHGLLKPHQMVGSVTMVDMSCSETLADETPRHVRGVRLDKTRRAYEQYIERNSVPHGRSRSRDRSDDEKPRYEKIGQSIINGGKSRGRKSRRRKSRRRKSRRRKSRRRKSRRRKSRRRKSLRRKSLRRK